MPSVKLASCAQTSPRTNLFDRASRGVFHCFVDTWTTDVIIDSTSHGALSFHASTSTFSCSMRQPIGQRRAPSMQDPIQCLLRLSAWDRKINAGTVSVSVPCLATWSSLGIRTDKHCPERFGTPWKDKLILGTHILKGWEVIWYQLKCNHKLKDKGWPGPRCDSNCRAWAVQGESAVARASTLWNHQAQDYTDIWRSVECWYRSP